MVEIVSSKPLPVPLVKEILEQLQETLGDNHVFLQVLDYARRFSKCSPEQAHAAMEKLVSIGFTEFAAAMLINLMPSDVEEAKALLGDIDGGYEDEKIEEAVKMLSEACGGGEESSLA